MALAPRLPTLRPPPDDFIDEETVVTDRAPAAGLTVLDGARGAEPWAAASSAADRHGGLERTSSSAPPDGVAAYSGLILGVTEAVAHADIARTKERLCAGMQELVDER